MKKRTFGIAGTAKNTGKTTTTIALLNYFHGRGVTLGLTSIGYDGECIDNVTGLPKPRLFLPRGVLVVTAQKCLEMSSAKISVKERLDIDTPLGKLVCGVVERAGLLVTAGPNRSKHLRVVRDWLYCHGAELNIVDGALNRIAPMVETDGLILATGAAYNPDIEQVALAAHYLDTVCNLPGPAANWAHVGNLASTKTIIWNHSGEILAETDGSLFNPEQLSPLMNAAGEAAGFFCPGVMLPPCLKQLTQLPFPPGLTYIFSDPTKIIIGHDLVIAHDFLDKISNRGGVVSYRRKLPLLAVTINPFYPQFRYETGDYQTAYVDREQLLKCVSERSEVPVFDVVVHGCEKLAEIL